MDAIPFLNLPRDHFESSWGSLRGLYKFRSTASTDSKSFAQMDGLSIGVGFHLALEMSRCHTLYKDAAKRTQRDINELIGFLIESFPRESSVNLVLNSSKYCTVPPNNIN